ncbi:Glutathione s-transferase-like protein [Hibiscus syriacus]|uniref:Glutathione s-transferase-like protein n=1 Tax=Hibiscus syriacus TaxID=106335 RepID=A0A6A3ASW9_HIBSY|nr:Glutathione s-transferase-like protein [Hibiscus syriacus]
MAAALKLMCVMGLIVLISILAIGNVAAAGECGKSSPDNEALKLAPCAEAALDAKAPVSAACCAKVKNMGRNPSCLCAILLSNAAKASGIKLENAITIPKRCNIANRPVGYKCGRES